MSKGSGNGTTRGDRRRNARRERLRELLPRDGAVIGIDLAEDKQALAVVDHDVRVLARKTVKVKAFRLGEALDWAVAQAKVKGFKQTRQNKLGFQLRRAYRLWYGERRPGRGARRRAAGAAVRAAAPAPGCGNPLEAWTLPVSGFL